jgi:hypothetical protein
MDGRCYGTYCIFPLPESDIDVDEYEQAAQQSAVEALFLISSAMVASILVIDLNIAAAELLK